MSLKQILTLISLAAASSGFTIPQNQPDGVYIATKLENGTTSHARIGDAGLMSRGSMLNRNHARQTLFNPSSTGCNGGSVSAADWLGATNALASQCANTPIIQKGDHAYATSGDAVAFMCNYGGPNPCVASELNTALTIIGAECLNYEPGWALSSAWAKSYGYDSVASEICTNE